MSTPLNGGNGSRLFASQHVFLVEKKKRVMGKSHPPPDGSFHHPGSSEVKHQQPCTTGTISLVPSHLSASEKIISSRPLMREARGTGERISPRPSLFLFLSE
jgi:hypothetical protein